MDISKAAAALGRLGGQQTSEKKQQASRENGKKGGRPRCSCHLGSVCGPACKRGKHHGGCPQDGRPNGR